MQINKTDKNDAYGLAQIVKAGWYREVTVKSLDSHTVRAMLASRFQLVGMRVDTANQIRGTLKTFGIVLRRIDGQSFEKLVEAQLVEVKPMVDNTLRSLLSVNQSLKDQIWKLCDTG
jgi:transposase